MHLFTCKAPNPSLLGLIHWARLLAAGGILPAVVRSASGSSCCSFRLICTNVNSVSCVTASSFVSRLSSAPSTPSSPVGFRFPLCSGESAPESRPSAEVEGLLGVSASGWLEEEEGGSSTADDVSGLSANTNDDCSFSPLHLLFCVHIATMKTLLLQR